MEPQLLVLQKELHQAAATFGSFTLAIVLFRHQTSSRLTQTQIELGIVLELRSTSLPVHWLPFPLHIPSSIQTSRPQYQYRCRVRRLPPAHRIHPRPKFKLELTLNCARKTQVLIPNLPGLRRCHHGECWR